MVVQRVRMSVVIVLLACVSIVSNAASDMSSSVIRIPLMSSWQVGLEGGTSFLAGDAISDAAESRYEDNTQVGYSAGIRFGYGITTRVVIEGEFLYLRNEGYDEGSSFAERIYMSNLLYGFEVGHSVTFVLGMGFGVIDPDASKDSYYLYQDGGIVKAKPGYQALVGVSYALADHLALTFGYHYIVPIGSETDADKPGYLPKVNLINAGVTYYF